MACCPMSLTIAKTSPLSADSRALVAESQRALEEVYPPDEIFSFDAEELAGEDTTFLVARGADGMALGCVAMVRCGDYAEVKRLYVRPEGRGQGVARALMSALEREARAQGCGAVLLETGDKLAAAVALYDRLGYRVRGPFGAYPEHPASLFMGKVLA